MLSPSTPLGAFTSQTVAAVNAALAQAGIFTTGNIYYLDPVNGLDTNNGQSPIAPVSPNGQGPVKTLAAGYALLRSGKNDVLVLISDGTASSSARITTFTWSKNAAHLIGLCSPSVFSQRARIAFPTTSGLTVTANFFLVSGNGCYFGNFELFQGAGSGQTGIAAEICLTVSGSRNVFDNVHAAGMGDSTGATDAGSRNLLVTAGENYFRNCTIGIDTVTRTNANATLEFQSGAARNVFDNCLFPIYSSDGLQHWVLTSAAAAMDRFTLFRNCFFWSNLASGATTLAEAFKLAASTGGGLVLDSQCNWIATAVGDATTKAQVWMGGVAGVATGGKLLVAS